MACYTWDGARFVGRELEVGPDDVAEAASLLLEDPAAGEKISVVDVLVCGHGRRDRCCGALGTALYDELTGTFAAGSPVRLWRTSHTGGHRFAPTALVLGDGTAWAYLDAERLSEILARTLPVPEAVRLYRGCAGMSTHRVQAVERAVFAELGWDIFGHARGGEEIADGRVRFEAAGRTWLATVHAGRRLPVPVCGSEIGLARKFEEELVVARLELLATKRYGGG